MKILVTGGAGYIGSVVSEELVQHGHDISVMDDLRQGHSDNIPPSAEFFPVDICVSGDVEEVFRRRRFEAVVHLAAESIVSQSVRDPARFFAVNVSGGINILDAMRKNGVSDIIFSSSAAVYGEPESTPITEEHVKIPLNPYGETKFVFERVLAWYGKAYGIRHVSLRYFNASGAAHGRGEDHRPETHLIPNVLRAALGQNPEPVKIFGSDYPTKDGSCVRDYIHVSDIARAHLQALSSLDKFGSGVYNLGSGSGYSVKQVIAASRRVTGAPIPTLQMGRRQGDPAILVAGANKARTQLGWKPEFTALEPIIESAWKWMKTRS